MHIEEKATLEFDGMEIEVYRSPRDGRIIVGIDTPELSGEDVDENEVPRIRVWLNDTMISSGTLGDQECGLHGWFPGGEYPDGCPECIQADERESR